MDRHDIIQDDENGVPTNIAKMAMKKTLFVWNGGRKTRKATTFKYKAVIQLGFGHSLATVVFTDDWFLMMMTDDDDLLLEVLLVMRC